MIQLNTVLFDEPTWSSLLPLTYTRPVADIRVGITTIREKWAHYAPKLCVKTVDYLSIKHKCVVAEDNLFINASLIPTPNVVDVIAGLKKGACLLKNGALLAFRSAEYDLKRLETAEKVELGNDAMLINTCWDIFSMNGDVMKLDFENLTKGKTSQQLSSSNNVLCPENVFVEEGAKVEFATINASSGPVYIGKNAEVMEGAMIRGSFALCESSVVKMGAKIYEDTTIGPWSKVGGEVQNSVVLGYSNKGHDGYLGNSILGEWCNLGADTNTSNLKNNYAKVRVWDYDTERFKDTGLQFCGLIMGDHSKCGINTMFNTGTVVGVSANIFGSGFPRNFVPSFSWGGAAGFSIYPFHKAKETAKVVLGRRKKELSDVEENILKSVFSMTEKFRK